MNIKFIHFKISILGDLNFNKLFFFVFIILKFLNIKLSPFLISSISEEEASNIDEKIKYEKDVSSKVLTYINNPDGRIKYKYIRKISCGINSKDLIYNNKDKSAFYNCFVMTIRISLT